MRRGNKKRLYFSIERLLIVVLVVAISVIAVRAVDNFQDREQSPCPAGMVFVGSSGGGFCIDKYEASPGEDCLDDFPENMRETMINMEKSGCRSVSRAGQKPWTFVSRDQAAEICRMGGKRLPTAAEWQSAALGTLDAPAGNCQLSNNWDEQPGPGGQGDDCVSGVGAYDMIGNVWEWVSDEVVDGVYRDMDLPAAGYIQAMSSSGLPAQTADTPNQGYGEDYLWLKTGGLKAVAKGGYYDSGSDGGRYSTYVEASPSFTGPGVGFRCVK
jgi:formylglycine-generating enzyme required for sulfatase activity